MKLIFVALIILLLTEPMFAQITVAKVGEIRGQVADTVNGESNLNPIDNSFTWNPQNFDGFYYDIKDGLGTETLEVTLTENNKLSGDSPYGVKYETKAQLKAFKFEDWGVFNVMGFLADRYFAGYVSNENPDMNLLFKESTDENSLSSEQLQKILIDDDNETTFTSGTPLKLEEGYELAIRGIDINSTKIYLELSKDGSVVDQKVVSSSKTYATMADTTYYYKNPHVGDQKKLITIAAHFKNISRGAGPNLATIDGLWQISGEATVVKADTQYDKMTITSVDANAGTITMENKDNAITLSKNMDTVLMGGVGIRTDDNDTLSFYIYTNQSLAAAWRQKCEDLYKQARLDEAIKAQIDKGNSHYNAGEYAAAIRYYDEAIKQDPKDKYAWYNKAMALRMLHRDSEAKAAYTKARELGYGGTMTLMEMTA